MPFSFSCLKYLAIRAFCVMSKVCKEFVLVKRYVLNLELFKVMSHEVLMNREKKNSRELTLLHSL